MPLTIVQAGAFPFPTRQGSQVYVRGMATALARRGHRVIVACYGAGEGTVSPLLDVVRTPRLPGVAPHLGSGPHRTKLPNDVLLVAALRRLIRRGVDVIHAHNVEAPVLAALAGRRRTPLVYNLHTAMGEELPAYFTGRLTRRLMGVAGEGVDHLVARLADASVAISPNAADVLRAHGATDVTLVPPGIDLAELEGADAERARRRWDLGDRPWVVYAGNLDPYQDLPDLLAAMARVPDAGLLVVTGADVAPLHAFADAAGLPAERRRFVGGAGFADSRDALAAAAVAASPRARCAGFPIKLLNQLGLGVPTVAAAGSAAPIDGVVAVPNHDPAAMAATIAGLLADPARRRALGEAARAAIARDYTWDRQAERLEVLYARLAERVTRAPRRA